MLEKKIEHKIVCLHQIEKPKFSLPIFTGNGIGNCKECLYDLEKNKKCKMYVPVAEIIFYVHPKEEKEK